MACGPACAQDDQQRTANNYFNAPQDRKGKALTFCGWLAAHFFHCSFSQGKGRKGGGKDKGRKGKGKRRADGQERAVSDPYGGVAKRGKSSNVQCYNCGGRGHFADDCPSTKE